VDPIRDRALVLVRALERAVEKPAEAAEALRSCGWPDDFIDKRLAYGWHALSHYATEQASYAADPDYGAAVRSRLGQFAREIRQACDLKDDE
jgi:hypothetical protein